MARGQTCPHCNEETFHMDGSVRKCSNCETIGWGWNNPTNNVGQGRGNTCPNCSNLTLHDVATVEGKFIARRCTICNYSLIEPHN